MKRQSKYRPDAGVTGKLLSRADDRADQWIELTWTPNKEGDHHVQLPLQVQPLVPDAPPVELQLEVLGHCLSAKLASEIP